MMMACVRRMATGGIRMLSGCDGPGKSLDQEQGADGSMEGDGGR